MHVYVCIFKYAYLCMHVYWMSAQMSESRAHPVANWFQAESEFWTMHPKLIFWFNTGLCCVETMWITLTSGTGTAIISDNIRWWAAEWWSVLQYTCVSGQSTYTVFSLKLPYLCIVLIKETDQPWCFKGGRVAWHTFWSSSSCLAILALPLINHDHLISSCSISELTWISDFSHATGPCSCFVFVFVQVWLPAWFV